MARTMIGVAAIAFAIACGFLAAYVLAVGALIYVNVVVFGLGDSKFSHALVQAWLEVYWPLWTIVYSPAAATALLAAWYSRLPLRNVWVLLGLFLALIAVAMEVAFVYDVHLLVIVGELTLLTVIFFLIARMCRRPNS
jgi:hypothetical protein